MLSIVCVCVCVCVGGGMQAVTDDIILYERDTKISFLSSLEVRTEIEDTWGIGAMSAA